MLYNVFIYPLVFVAKSLYLGLYALTDSYGVSLLLLSVLSSVLMHFCTKLVKKYSDKENQMQQILGPEIDKIKKESVGEERHRRISNLYKRYSYNPIYSLRTALPLLVQLPFLLGAYYMLSRLEALNGESFLIVNDLSLPDGLLLNINIFPIVMTLVNIVTTYINQDFVSKEKYQALGVAVLFLFLLYGAPSALLIFWTTNNVIFFFRTLLSRLKASDNKQLSATKKDVMKRGFKPILSMIKSHAGSYIVMFFSYMLLFYIYKGLASHSGIGLGSRYHTFLYCVVSCIFWLVMIARRSSFISSLRWKMAMIITISLNILTPIFVILLRFGGFTEIHVSLNSALFAISMSFFLSSVVSKILQGNFKRGKILRNKQEFFILLLFPLAPAVHLASVNGDYLAGWFYGLYFVTVLLFITINYFYTRLFSSYDTIPKNIIYGSTLFSSLFLTLPLYRSMFPLLSTLDVDFLIIFGLILTFTYLLITKIAVKKVFAVGIIVLTVFTLNFVVSFLEIASTDKGNVPQIPEVLSEISFNENPNIYLFVYDGIPNERVFRFLDIPSDRLNGLLAEYDFKHYENTYSLGASTLPSMSMLLNMTDKKEEVGINTRNVYSGNSVVNHTLRAAGYSTYKILEDGYTGSEATINLSLGYVDEIYPPHSAWIVNIDFFAILIRGIFQGELRFDTKGLTAIEGFTPEEEQEKKLELIRRAKEKAFVVNHYYMPGHTSNRGRLYPEDREKWINDLGTAIDQMEKDFQAIEEYDPNAIVIAIGDHGPYLTADGFRLKGYELKDITPEMMWDRVGTLIAIRWPNPEKASKYDQDLILNQEIFSVVFSYLSDTNLIDSLSLDRTFSGFGIPRFGSLSERRVIKFREGEIMN